MTATHAPIHPADQATECDSHYIGGTVRVRLMRDLSGTDSWVVDPASFGTSLDLEHPVENTECRCTDPDDCERIRMRMFLADLPDGEELMHMLADSLGYTVTKN
ncbi:hypothetical protein [Prescottella subtropica]|uniref:hypothetical protein n=1 Tax=Prescottella subtropica TaxID=2545757 RepID=UPI0010F6B24C|nr:hypothetical protein [Prescottella subtropica]